MARTRCTRRSRDVFCARSSGTLTRNVAATASHRYVTSTHTASSTPDPGTLDILARRLSLWSDPAIETRATAEPASAAVGKEKRPRPFPETASSGAWTDAYLSANI